MFRTLNQLFLVGVLSLACLAGLTNSVSAQAPQQFTVLTKESFPQMLKQAGYLVESKIDKLGPFWIIVNPKSGKMVAAIPVQLQGNEIKGLILDAPIAMPGGGVTTEQIKQVNAKLPVGHWVEHFSATNQLVVTTDFTYPDSNSQELAQRVEGLLAAANQAEQLLTSK